MVVYGMFHIKPIPGSALRIDLLSDNYPNCSYTFGVILNITPSTGKFYHNFLFGKYYALSKSLNIIQLRNNDSQETLCVTQELLSKLILEVQDQTRNIDNDFLKSCVHNWSSDIPGLCLRNDFSSETIEENINPASEEIIYIPGERFVFDQEEIVNTCEEYMEALGSDIQTNEPFYSFFWQKSKVFLKKNVTEEDIQSLFENSQKILELLAKKTTETINTKEIFFDENIEAINTEAVLDNLPENINKESSVLEKAKRKFQNDVTSA